MDKEKMILRSMLYVPSNSWRMIKSAITEGEDAVILDLEDACPLAEKETGRVFSRDAASMIKEAKIDFFVRVNSFDTGLTEEDINYVVVDGLDGIMLPKAESGEDVDKLDRLISEVEQKKGLTHGGIAMIPLIETPKGVSKVEEIISASDRVIAVSFGAGDYSREIGAGMGVTRLSSEEYNLMAYYPRCQVALAARAAGVLAIDSPYFGYVIDIDGLVEETSKVKLMGFTGKQLTHPRHVSPVNQVFSPSEEEIDFAEQVNKAFEEAQAKGLGATTIGGRMIDYGSYKRATNLLAAAERIAEKDKARIL